MINFILPGFDGLDERRGNYSGSAEDLGKLIVLILDTRKASNQWYTGLLLFYRNTAFAYGFGKGPNQASMLRLLNKNEYR